jgi:hypothetical protein
MMRTSESPGRRRPHGSLLGVKPTKVDHRAPGPWTTYAQPSSPNCKWLTEQQPPRIWTPHAVWKKVRIDRDRGGVQISGGADHDAA